MEMFARYHKILGVMESHNEPLSSKEIANKYLNGLATASDALATGSILNALELANKVNRHESYRGRSIRVKYSLKESKCTCKNQHPRDALDWRDR